MPVKSCVSCAGALGASRIQQTQKIGEREFVVVVAALTCHNCAAVYLEHGSLQRAELEIGGELARHGPPSGEAFRYLRKSLEMRASSLASLLGVTPETISRWENGQRTVDRTAWIVLGSLVLESSNAHPGTLGRLRALRSAEPAVRETHIDVSGASEPRVRGSRVRRKRERAGRLGLI